jgi:hypothetical protein
MTTARSEPPKVSNGNPPRFERRKSVEPMPSVKNANRNGAAAVQNKSRGNLFLIRGNYI